jgi:F-type H+-transporting ATPase subunit delta
VIEQGGALARIYATALFELAEERNTLDERAGEVRTLFDVLSAKPGFRPVIESPMVETERKNALVRDVLGDRFSRDLRNLVLLLVDKNRQHLLMAVLETFLELYDESKGMLKATLTTAVPLAEGEADRLSAGLSEKVGKRILLGENVDPGILGGAVLRFGDYIVDGSLRSRIDKLRDELLTPSEERGS